MKLLSAAICGALMCSAAYGQNTFIYTNVNGADIGLTASWTNAATGAHGVPSGATQDTAEWNGVTSGNLVVYYNTGWGNSGFGTSGVNLLCTASQIGSVQITTTGSASPAAGIFGITNNSPSGVLRIGESGTAHQMSLATRPGTAGTIHGFVNNSTSAAILDSSVTWVAGGGVACVMDFGGTGDWIVNHNLRDNNSGAGPITVQWEGPGTMSWSSGGTFLSSDPNGPINVMGGTMALKSAGLCLVYSGVGSGVNWINISSGATVKYDAATSDTIARTIAGLGSVQVNNGTLTLSGNNTYAGSTLLSGGEVVVSSAENLGVTGPLGTNGVISFTGGTLGYSVNNTYDYSPRFSTAAGQAVRIDTGGQAVTLTNALTSSGGTFTKLGAGTLTLTGANTYGGLTAIGAGKLVIQGSQGSGSIVVSNSTTLSVTGSGAQLTPSSLVLGTTSGATLEFNSVSSTSTPIINSGTISAGGTITVNVNSGSFLIGASYPLVHWTSGTAPTFSLGTLTGAGGNLSVSGNTLYLNITSLAFVWTGNANGNWDITTANNWKVNGVFQLWGNGGTALFDDTAPGQTNITLNAPINPASTTVNASTKTYSITSSGANIISGSGTLTKNGNTTLTLAGGLNTYGGATILNGGILSISTLATGGSASDIGSSGSTAANLVLNGGTLQVTGSSQTSDRLFTLGTAGGTIDDESASTLTLNNSGAAAMSGSGARTLTLTGNGTDELDASLSDNGGATALTKNGAGKWIVTANNPISGAVTVIAGTLQVGTGGATGNIGSGNIALNANSALLDLNTAGTISCGTISGSGAVQLDGSGTVIIPGNNTYSGGTTLNAGTLQVGIGGSTGSLAAGGAIANNGTAIIFNSTGDSTISGIISGSGQLIKRGSGLLKFIGNNTYTGTTTVDTGAQLQLTQGNTGQNASTAITNNGTLICMRQDNGVFVLPANISGSGHFEERVSNGNNGDTTFTGVNTYTGGTYVLGGGLILGDNATPGAGSIVGNINLTNDYIHNTTGTAPNDFVPATLTFNRPDDFVFPGIIVGNGFVTLTGSGAVTLTGNNTYTNTGTGAATTVNAGKLVVGNGGTTGTAGTGNIANNAELDFNRSDSITVSSLISGAGTVFQIGSGTTILTRNNTYSGDTTISNGILNVTGASLAGNVNVDGGQLAPGSLSVGGSLAVGGNLTINAGGILAPLNRALSSTNLVVTGIITNIGGSLQVTNSGAALVVGDKFYIFNQPVTGFSSVTGAGATWQNNLAVDGSITALTVPVTVNTNPPSLTLSVSGNTLTLGWPTNQGWRLQTNGAGLNSPGAWGSVSGTASLTNYSITIDPAKSKMFFRMVYP